MKEIFTNLPLGFVNEDKAFWSQSNGPDAPVWAVDAQMSSHVVPVPGVSTICVYQLVPFGTTSPHELPPLGVFFYNWWW